MQNVGHARQDRPILSVSGPDMLLRASGADNIIKDLRIVRSRSSISSMASWLLFQASGAIWPVVALTKLTRSG